MSLRSATEPIAAAGVARRWAVDRRRLLLVVEMARVAGVACAVELALRVSRLPRVAQWCGVRLDVTSASTTGPRDPDLPARTQLQRRAVALVMRRWPFGDTCLRRCLVLGQRLRGLDPVLRIGVAMDREQGFRGHSWLEVHGYVLGGDRDFTAFGHA